MFVGENKLFIECLSGTKTSHIAYPTLWRILFIECLSSTKTSNRVAAVADSQLFIECLYLISYTVAHNCLLNAYQVQKHLYIL